MWTTNDDGEEDDDSEPNWYTGFICGKDKQDDYWRIVIRMDSGYNIPDSDEDTTSTWEINLHEDNLEYFKIWVKEWDD
jgi:hypothetical protein